MGVLGDRGFALFCYGMERLHLLGRFLESICNRRSTTCSKTRSRILYTKHPALDLWRALPRHPDSAVLGVFECVDHQILDKTVRLDSIALHLQCRRSLGLEEEPTLLRRMPHVLADL